MGKFSTVLCSMDHLKPLEHLICHPLFLQAISHVESCTIKALEFNRTTKLPPIMLKQPEAVRFLLFLPLWWVELVREVIKKVLTSSLRWNYHTVLQRLFWYGYWIEYTVSLALLTPFLADPLCSRTVRSNFHSRAGFSKKKCLPGNIRLCCWFYASVFWGAIDLLRVL